MPNSGEVTNQTGMVAGDKAPLYSNRSQLLDGIKHFSGDAQHEPEAPSTETSVEVDAEQSNPPTWLSQETVDAAKKGAKMGAIFSTISNGYDAIKSRNFDPKKLATKVAVGVGVGAMHGVIAHSANKPIGRAIDAIGWSVSSEAAATVGSLARSAAIKLGSAAIAGASVNAGLSAFKQIPAYRQGEVTGSQAIGSVAGEALLKAGVAVAGAAASAAIGRIVPFAGGMVIPAVGFAASRATDELLSSGGFDKAVAKMVTASFDKETKSLDGMSESSDIFESPMATPRSFHNETYPGESSNAKKEIQSDVSTQSENSPGSSESHVEINLSDKAVRHEPNWRHITKVRARFAAKSDLEKARRSAKKAMLNQLSSLVVDRPETSQVRNALSRAAAIE
jgi:hypothetical protein